MKFQQPLIKAHLIKRYKRFLADVTLTDGSVVVAHCANSGSMKGCQPEGATVWLSPNTNPKAKLDYRWELVDVDGTLVGINTSRPNGIVEEAILDGSITELQGYGALKREVKYGKNSRIDILLSEPAKGGADKCYVEVKNVTLTDGSNQARFPDSVTTRGTKHLNELVDMVHEGHRAVMVYLVQRGDCDHFTTADEIDSVYGDALRHALKAGVEAYCYMCDVTPDVIKVTSPLPIRL